MPHNTNKGLILYIRPEHKPSTLTDSLYLINFMIKKSCHETDVALELPK